MNKMTHTTSTGRELIPTDLVGQQAVLQDGKYNDAYLTRLNQAYSLAGILGSKKEMISRHDGPTLNRLTRDSVLQNLEGERVLRFILKASAPQGLWQPEIINCKEFEYDTIGHFLADAKKPLITSEGIDECYMYGVRVAHAMGFILPTSYENNLVLLPSQTCLEYFIARIDNKDR